MKFANLAGGVRAAALNSAMTPIQSMRGACILERLSTINWSGHTG